MIGVYDLKDLLSIYGIDYKKVLKNNSNIIEKGVYDKINRTLDYLINTLKITPNNIEKCPSIMYFNVNTIKYNYTFLKSTNINISDVETCLHILSTDPDRLIQTYNYVNTNYGIEYINKITSILGVDVYRIKQIEGRYSKYLTKLNVLSASISRLDIDEIGKVIYICLNNNIEITGSVFKKSAEEIEKIINVCKENNIEITGSVFYKSAEEIEKIIKVCKENNIEIIGNVFKKSAEEIESIVRVCRENNIEIIGSVFLKSAKQLQENIEFIKTNYGEEYLKPLIVSKNIKTLQKVLPHLNELGVLKFIKSSASILLLTLEEIIERKEFVDSIGADMVVNGKFNSIFGMSKKKYQERKKSYSK